MLVDINDELNMLEKIYIRTVAMSILVFHSGKTFDECGFLTREYDANMMQYTDMM